MIIGLGEMSEKKIESILVKRLGRLVVGRPTGKQNARKKPLVINDQQWKSVSRLIPKSNDQINTRDVLNGVLFAFEGKRVPKRLPKSLPDCETCVRELERWKKAGVWPTICSKLLEFSSVEHRARTAEALIVTLLP